MPAIFNESLTQNKKLHGKPIANANSFRDGPVILKKPKPWQSYSVLGLAMPFQPCMWDDKIIDRIINDTIQQVKTRLKESYCFENNDKIVARLQKVFKQLNYHTHRKSVAIMLGPGIEKIIYLDYPVKSTTWFGKDFSLLNLSVNIEKEPRFFFLILAGSHIRLFEYKENHLIKIATQTIKGNEENKGNAGEAIMKTTKFIRSLTNRMAHPVFISTDLVRADVLVQKGSLPINLFNSLQFGEQYDEEKVKALVNTISKDWKRWYNKYISDLLKFSQKANGLIWGIEPVLDSLKNGNDGLLLIDKKIKAQLLHSNSGHINFSRYELLKQYVEKFLERGNFLEITNNNLLKQAGGMVLINEKQQGHNEDIYLPRHSKIDFSIY